MKYLPYIISGITVVAIVFIGVVALGESKQDKSIASYQTTDASRPRVVTTTMSEDFGRMKVSDERTATFTIDNTGTKPLSLYGGTTSCGCTFGQIETRDGKSPEFSMHSKSTWSGAVNPREKATVYVTYKPSVMPVKGPVSRTATIKTNDPEKPELSFTVSADVE